MKPTLQLRLGQSLTLTPQLRQAIRLLQLSSVELETEINQALESNPLLDRPDDQPSDEPDDREQSDRERIADESPESTAEPAQEADYADLEQDWSLSDSYSGALGSGSSSDSDLDERQEARPETLGEHLIWQLGLTPLSDKDQAIGLILIDALDSDGYLRESEEALIATLASSWQVTREEIEAVRHLIQHFDPIGVASRDLADCLGVQLRMLSADTPGRDLALRLVVECLDTLPKQSTEKLAHRLGTDVEEVGCALDLLRSLDPRPGGQLSPSAPEYVVPDAIAYRHHGQWHVRLGSASAPRLGINRHYQSLIATASREDAGYLRGQLQEAKWLIRALETRAETLIKVARYIVEHQSAFLDHGPEAMRPLVLRQVAEDVGLHESTISRVTTRKFLDTPRGTFELKYFFSSALATEDGGAASSTAIQAMIRRLVDAEDACRPLSDARLTEELKREGVTVARRTVAKYREAMNIPSSSERQRAG